MQLTRREVTRRDLVAGMTGLLLTSRVAQAQVSNTREILNNVFLTTGWNMGVNSSRGRTDWLTKDPPNGMKMAYPPGQEWGAVFITWGVPKDPPHTGTD